MRRGKKGFYGAAVSAALILTLSLFQAGCGPSPSPPGAVSVTDCLGNKLLMDGPPGTVVSLQASLSDIWLLAGGTLAGVTDDCGDYGIETDAAVIGSTKHPSAEAVMALKPDLVIYSGKITGQTEAAAGLRYAGIKTFGAVLNGFEDYLRILKQFTVITGKPEAYAEYGTAVSEKIERIRAAVPATGRKPSALLIRAYPGGFNTVARNNFVCDILSGLGAENIAADKGASLNDVSLEYVSSRDPDFIFVVYMGGKHTAQTEASLEANLYSLKPWKELSAVRNGNVHVLPVSLFHFKPNARWAEAYGYLYEILYGKN